jgi:hypothetical protein
VRRDPRSEAPCSLGQDREKSRLIGDMKIGISGTSSLFDVPLGFLLQSGERRGDEPTLPQNKTETRASSEIVENAKRENAKNVYKSMT